MTPTLLVNNQRSDANQSRTIVDTLRYQAALHSDRKAFSFLRGESIEESFITFGEMDLAARRLAACLQDRNAEGARALLLYPAGIDFIVALLGCIYAKVTAVPAALPHSKRRYDTVAVIAKDCEAAFILTTSKILESLRGSSLPGLDANLTLIATDNIEAGAEADWRMPVIEPSTLAYLQYTSGSTSAPKGVMVCHENVLHNLKYIDYDFQFTPDSVSISWLPHFHDMGLLFGVLQPIFSGFHCYLMSPVAFLQQPMQWLHAISLFGATHSGGPNFAYELCVQKSTPESRESLRLDHWKVAFNGAEPVRVDTLDRFVRMYAPRGFRKEALYPAYGLAEATLKVSGRFYTEGSIIPSRGLKAEELPDQALKSPRALIGLGKPACDMKVAIASPELRAKLEPGQTGEIWVSGPSIAKGYWNKPKETEEIFCARLCDDPENVYLRTGDLGFLCNDELFITGRLKDLIIIRGHNYYAEDIESSIEGSHTALRKGAVSAFSVDVDGTEKLVIIQELVRHYTEPLEEVFEAIRAAVARSHDLHTHNIVLVRMGTVPKTTSGKIQRHRCRELFLARELDEVASSTTPEISAEELPSLSRDKLTRLSDEERQQHVTSYARGLVAGILKVKIRQIDPGKSLLSFGLDSMMAAELSIKLQRDLGVRLQPVEFLGDVRLDDLISLIINALSTEATDSQIDVQPGDGDFALSYGQESLWYQYKLAPQSAAYNIARAIRLGTTLDAGALHRTCQKLLERHASLRTAFVVSNSDVRQRIRPNVEIPFEIFDASAWAEDVLNNMMQQEADRPFDLEADLPVRFKLFQSPARGNILLMVFHHIVVDFWSLALLVKELGETYTAESVGKPIDLAARSCDYKAYVRRQAQMLGETKGEVLRTYWLKNLAGDLPVMDISSRRRPATQSFEGASHLFKLSPQTLEGVKRLCSVYKTTPNMVLLSVFHILLHRYSGQEDIIIGSPTAGRSCADFAETIGYFVNPVAIRADLSADTTFAEFLKQLRQTSLKALEHHEYPFSLLVDQLQPGRDISRSPIFQVMFVWQKPPVFAPEDLSLFALGASGAKVRFGKMEMESVALKPRVSQFDLTLTACEAAGELVSNIEYSTDLFEPSTIQRMAEHFEMLLGSIIKDPTQSISHLQLVTELEQQLFAQWADTSVDYGRSETLSELFEEQVKRTPTEIALAFEDQVLTYDELNGRANKLARRLRRQGVVRDVLAGILMERSVEMVIGLLGILKAGGAYVPFDPHYPQERLSFMLEDAQPKTVLTEQRFADRAGLSGAHVLALDSDWHLLSDESDKNLEPAATADSLAYVIYTSGSTGRPKGVMIPHRGLVNYLNWCTNAYSVGDASGAPVHSPISFDLTITSLFAPLLSGKCVRLLPEERAVESLAEALLWQQSEFSLVKLTPAHLAVLTQLLPSNGATVQVQSLVIGGEALSKEAIADWQRKANGRRLINEYGPTETVVGCIVYEVGSGDAESFDQAATVPIGHPIANTQVYILDKWLHPAPIGAVGEIAIGGDGLARGYLNRPDLTAEKFIPNPFGAAHGARMYKTGDLARYLPGGDIEFLGRVDDQIKIRGLRIEPGEVESGLLTFPGVKQVKVLAREDLRGRKQLAAYLITEHHAELNLSDLRSHLKARLPHWMIPEAFTLVEEWPVTASGKVDRNALLKLEPLHFQTENCYEPPDTETQARLAKIFAEVLGLERVGINHDFFELGGNSLLAMQIVSRIKNALQVEVSFIDLIAHAPTVAALSSLIEQRILENASAEEMLRALREMNGIPC
ncbi:MAG: amino acid adenylation domain-containing protein [Blastocatellia bacterium]